jgi:hypothetical protein
MEESMFAEVHPKSGKALTVMKQQPFKTLIIRKPQRKTKSRCKIKSLNGLIYMEEALLLFPLLLGPTVQGMVLRVEDHFCLAGGMVLCSPCGVIVTASLLLLLLLLLLLHL